MIEAFYSFDAATLLTFFAACIILFLTPGADMMFTIASGAAGGPKAGIAAAVGISIGVLVHVIIAAAGLAALILAYPAAYDAIRYVGAVYLAYLAVQMWRAGPPDDSATGATAIKRAFRRGFLTNILNPKVALFVLAFLPQFTNPDAAPVWAQIVVLGLILTSGEILAGGLVGALAGMLGERLRRGTHIMNRIAAVVFGGLAARLATQ